MNPRLKYLIPIINLLLMTVSWLLIYLAFPDKIDKNANAFENILDAFGKAMLRLEFSTMVFLFLFILSLTGTIVFYFIKKKEVYLGFRLSLIINSMIALFFILLSMADKYLH